MVKSVLGVNHQGLRDWIIQRLSAIIMILYTFMLMGFVFLHRPISFNVWHTFFGYTWVKVATLLFVSALLMHAWIGIWTVFTDYIKCSIIRAILNTLVILTLIAFFFWTLLILGRV